MSAAPLCPASQWIVSPLQNWDNYVIQWNLGGNTEETQLRGSNCRGWGWKSDTLCTTTRPFLCSCRGALWTHKCTQTGREGAHMHAPKPSREEKQRSPEQGKKRVPCSAFRCARPWKRSIKKTEKWEQHTNTTAVLSLRMLCVAANHDYHSKNQSFPHAHMKASSWNTETANYECIS